MPNRLVARVYAAVLPGKRRGCRLDELPGPGTVMELSRRSKRLPLVGFCILYSLALSTIIILGYCLVASTWSVQKPPRNSVLPQSLAQHAGSALPHVRHCGIELAPCHSREVVPFQYPTTRVAMARRTHLP